MVRAMAAAVTLGPAPGARQEKEGMKKEIILKRENLGFPRGSRLRQSINTLALQLPPIQLVLQAETVYPITVRRTRMQSVPLGVAGFREQG